MHRLWPYVRRQRWRLLLGGLLLLCTIAASMAVPQIFRLAIDGLHSGETSTRLRSLALALAAVAVVGATFRTLSRLTIFFAARDIEADLRCALYRHLTLLEPAYFERHPSGDLVSRATNDLTQVRMLFGPGLLNFVTTIASYAMAIPAMLALSPKLTVCALAVYPPGFFLMRRLGRRMYARSLETREALGRISDLVQETFAGLHVVRAFAAEAERERKLGVLNDAYYSASRRLTWTSASMYPLVMALGNVGILLAVIMGAHETIDGRLTPGALVALAEYMALLSWPTFALGWVLAMTQRGRASWTRISEVLQTQPGIADGALSPAMLVPSISARGLSLAFDARRVLDNVSLDIAPGSFIGIVGPIGSGKTALLSALMRLIDVTPGQLTLGGCDVTELTLATLRAQFGYVPQGAALFSRSVADNVSFARPEASREAIRAALAAAAFDPDLAALPSGVDTIVGERGITLSGGQKQRVALARAFLLDAPILVLDDSLSSVDGETEQRIIKTLATLRRGRTTLLIAHRLSAVQKADRIFVLDQGRLVEQGRHAELAAAGGWYAREARRQEQSRQESAHTPSAETTVAVPSEVSVAPSGVSSS